MTAHPRALAALLCFCLTILTPLAASARPVAVTLYPGAATVTEQARLQLADQDGRPAVSLALPASADPDSLRVFPDAASGLSPADVSIESIERRDEGRIKMVRGQLDQAKARLQELVDKRAGHEGAADYWRSVSGADMAKAQDASAMAKAVRQGLIAETAAASALTRDIEAQDKVVKELQDELNRLTGGSVRILVASVTLAGPAAKEADFRWSYRMNAAGWTPRYTLDARPGKGVVEFAWDAEIHQQSGTPWADVDVTLATAEFRGGHTPPPLPPWRIRPQAPLLRKARNVASDLAAKLETAPMMAEAPAPERSEGRIFDSYDAGKTSLQSGASKRLPLERASWKAEFDYLLRPAMGPGAYTRATLELSGAPKYPRGPATYLLDSAMVRTASLSLYSQKAELFFGTDPQIEVGLVPLARQSGTAGFLRSRNTHSWDWRINIDNAKSIPVALRLEERIPAIGDERIELEKRLPGAVEEEGGVAVWSLELKPGQHWQQEYGFTITYPEDMRLDLGGR